MELIPSCLPSVISRNAGGLVFFHLFSILVRVPPLHKSLYFHSVPGQIRETPAECGRVGNYVPLFRIVSFVNI